MRAPWPQIRDHPLEWRYDGVRELAGERQANRILDRPRVLWCLGIPEQQEAFDRW